VIIVVKADQIKNTFFLDIEVQSNVISQCFAVISEMIKLNTEMLQFLFLNNHSSYCYDAYLVQYYLKDDWKQKYNCEHVFYVMNKNEFKLILSLSALRKKNIHINCELMIWCFEIDLWMFILKNAEDFEETINKLVTCVFFDLYLKWRQCTFKVLMLHLLFFSSMQNMRMFFFKVEVRCLFVHEKHDHVIDTNDENFSYKFLYNLSDKELQVLWNYLNNILVKS